MAKLELIFADGERVTVDCRSGETVLAAAARNGFPLASDCEFGDCQTCRGRILRGAVDYGKDAFISLTEDDLAAGAVLCCVARPKGDLAVDIPYSRADLLPRHPYKLEVTAVERLCDSVVAVRGRLGDDARMRFYPGQYVNITVPGSGAVRSYSMANAPGADEFEFHIRLLDSGVMSDYLRNGVAAGAVLDIAGPFGVFYLRQSDGPLIMVAGGTGVAPMVSMLRDMAGRGDTARPIILCHGVTALGDLYFADQLADLAKAFDAFNLRLAVMRPDSRWKGRNGTATDLLSQGDAAAATAYLCGPPAMIAAARRWFAAHGMGRDRVLAEEFTASGGA